MKKIVLAVLLSLFSSSAWAASDVWRSSHTATANTTQVLCPREFSVRAGHGILHAICVNNSVPAGTFTIYNSSGSAANTIAIVNTGSGAECFTYDVSFSSGLSYTSVSTASVTTAYSCQ